MKKVNILFIAFVLSIFAVNAQSKAGTNTQNTTAKTIYLTKADFLKKIMNYEKNPNEWIYLGDKPAIIDFYADWCGPCKLIAPIMEELAAKYEGEIYIYKVDTDKERELAGLFQIRSIPSLLFIPLKDTPQMSVGAMKKDQYIDAIEKILLKK